ncbi:MAG: hypothetical protein EOS34_32970 [Mesorhizobium sp.]|nr:MAG: hypothetical protein EOS34_32970 [Mesorhizobium sp.]
MQIRDVLLAPGGGTFFYDDQAAIRPSANRDRFIYVSELTSPRFTSIRVPASSVSVWPLLVDGTVVGGDMMSPRWADPNHDVSPVQYC